MPGSCLLGERNTSQMGAFYLLQLPLLSSRWCLLRIKKASLGGLKNSSCHEPCSSWLVALNPLAGQQWITTSPPQTSLTVFPELPAPYVTTSQIPRCGCLPLARCFWLLLEKRTGRLCPGIGQEHWLPEDAGDIHKCSQNQSLPLNDYE